MAFLNSVGDMLSLCPTLDCTSKLVVSGPAARIRVRDEYKASIRRSNFGGITSSSMMRQSARLSSESKAAAKSTKQTIVDCW